MRIAFTIFLITGFLFLMSCGNPEKTEDATKHSKAQVKVTNIKKGRITDYLVLSGKTIYMNKTGISSPIPGYVNKVNVKPGSRVNKGDLLFEIMTQEAYMLKDNDSIMKNFKPVTVHSPVKGIINRLDVVKSPVFVDKNSELCSIVDVNDLQVKADVPYEYRKLAEPGRNCIVELPDKSEYNAVFYNILPDMNPQSQTMKVLVQIHSEKLIPENMVVRVLIDKNDKTEKRILPKSCVLSDELMKEFWVMKIINDSTAIKVPVKIGRQNHDEVEILFPEFNKKDRIISEGGYGLADTSFVEIVK
jgi:hypothetical protein